MTICCRSISFLLLLTVLGLSSPKVAAGADDGFHRPDQDLSKWERTKESRWAKLFQAIEMFVSFGGCPWGRVRQKKYGAKPSRLIPPESTEPQ
jgi:hypothetical protein